MERVLFEQLCAQILLNNGINKKDFYEINNFNYSH